MEDVYNTIKKLRQIDSRLSERFRKLAQVQTKCKSLRPNIGSWFNQTFISGSLAEGGLWAKCFASSHNVVRILEADFMTPIGEMEDTEHLKPIERSPGFFTLPTNDLLECMYVDVRNSYQEWQADKQNQKTDEVCHTSSVLKFTIEKLFAQSDVGPNKTFELVADILFQPRESSKAETTCTMNGPSAVTVVKITSAEEDLIEGHIDTVPCVELCSWPSQCGYSQWLNRKRKWPPLQFVFDVQRLICIVAKAPPQSENEIDRENIWRLSFSKAEMSFVSTYTERQRDIYFLFKIMFYTNIKTFEIADKRMPSYFCKTTMFWVMEEKGETFGDGDFEEAIQVLFNRMKKFLEDRYFPNFFCPLVNLLDGYPDVLITICSDMIEKVIKKPLDYVPLTLNTEIEFLEVFEEKLNILNVEYLIDAVNDIMDANETNGRDAFELFLYIFNMIAENY